MAKKLQQFYDFTKQNGGILAQMRLAMMTGISSNKAEAELDSSDNIAKFRKAIKEITGKDAPVF